MFKEVMDGIAAGLKKQAVVPHGGVALSAQASPLDNGGALRLAKAAASNVTGGDIDEMAEKIMVGCEAA
jgi:hypothetical protein